MSKSRNRFFIWGGAFIAIALSVFVIVNGSANNTTSQDLDTTPITEDDWVKGNPEAKVELIEYSDFQCPACSNMHYLLKEIVGEFGNHIKFAFRHFPLRSIHNKADIAGQAANAAGYQGRFFEMHDLLFEEQHDWAKQSVEEAAQTFMGYAESLGLDMEQFKEDLTSKDNIEAMNDAYDHAFDVKLNATPTLFLNGKKLDVPRQFDDFRELIRKAIENE